MKMPYYHPMSDGRSCVHLCHRLPASVRIAGDAGERKPDDRRVDGEDSVILEAREKASGPFRRDEVWRGLAEMQDHLPVDFLGDFGSGPVGIGERVAPPRRRVAHERELPPVLVVVAYLREAFHTVPMGWQ